MIIDRPCTFILLEDNETDLFLLRRRLEKVVPNATLMVAQTQTEYEDHVRTVNADLIVSDYRLPQYSGIEALMFARKHAPVVPFVFVTGALHNEELAADTILKGASGFVLKNNLDKLDRILPTLLAGDAPSYRTPPKPAPKPEPVVEQPTFPLSSVMQDLAGADVDTLAEIKLLLESRRKSAAAVKG